MKLLVLLLAAAIWPLPAKAPEFNLAKFSDFMDAANRFERAYWGCPPTALNTSECSGGRFDKRLYDVMMARGCEFFQK